MENTTANTDNAAANTANAANTHPFDDEDMWGPVCRGCEYFDYPTKPCAWCEGPRRRWW